LHYRKSAEQSPSAAVAVQSSVEPEPEAANASRREHCINLATELRYLFAFSLFTMRDCIDPTKLLVNSSTREA